MDITSLQAASASVEFSQELSFDPEGRILGLLKEFQENTQTHYWKFAELNEYFRPINPNEKCPVYSLKTHESAYETYKILLKRSAFDKDCLLQILPYLVNHPDFSEDLQNECLCMLKEHFDPGSILTLYPFENCLLLNFWNSSLKEEVVQFLKSLSETKDHFCQETASLYLENYRDFNLKKGLKKIGIASSELVIKEFKLGIEENFFLKLSELITKQICDGILVKKNHVESLIAFQLDLISAFSKSKNIQFFTYNFEQSFFSERYFLFYSEDLQKKAHRFYLKAYMDGKNEILNNLITTVNHPCIDFNSQDLIFNLIFIVEDFKKKCSHLKNFIKHRYLDVKLRMKALHYFHELVLKKNLTNKEKTFAIWKIPLLKNRNNSLFQEKNLNFFIDSIHNPAVSSFLKIQIAKRVTTLLSHTRISSEYYTSKSKEIFEAIFWVLEDNSIDTVQKNIFYQYLEEQLQFSFDNEGDLFPLLQEILSSKAVPEKTKIKLIKIIPFSKSKITYSKPKEIDFYFYILKRVEQQAGSKELLALFLTFLWQYSKKKKVRQLIEIREPSAVFSHADFEKKYLKGDNELLEKRQELLGSTKGANEKI